VGFSVAKALPWTSLSTLAKPAASESAKGKLEGYDAVSATADVILRELTGTG